MVFLPTDTPRRYQFFGSGSGLGSCFRVKNLPWFLPWFLEPVLEPSSVRFSVFMRSPEFFLNIPNFGRYSFIFSVFLVGSSGTVLGSRAGSKTGSRTVLGSVLGSSQLSRTLLQSMSRSISESTNIDPTIPSSVYTAQLQQQECTFYFKQVFFSAFLT